MMSLKRGVKVAVSLVWYLARRSANAVRPGRRPSRMVILFYHAVGDHEGAAFRRQIQAVRAYADVVDPDYLGEPAGRPKVAITFDDAYMSAVDNALPELAAHGLAATIFVPTGCLGRHPTWRMEGSAPDRVEVVATGETLRGLASKGVRLGAHSRTHPMLTQIAADEARAEIGGSKSDMERLLGRPVDLFAFPYGDFDQGTLRHCADAGYRFVYSIGPGSVALNDPSMLRPRVEVEASETMIEFWLKIRGAYDWMPMASALKRRLLVTRAAAAFAPA